MSRLSTKRRILIVGEGRETEYNYFVGFRKQFEADLEAMATSVEVVRGRGGDARKIVERAIQARSGFQPEQRHNSTPGESVHTSL